MKELKNTRQKNIALRTYHGDIYTKDKLFKIGLIDSPACPKCGEIETKEHLLLRCPTTRASWEKLGTLLHLPTPIELRDILISNNSSELKIKLELIGLLLLPDRLSIDPEQTLKTILMKLVECNKKPKKENCYFRALLTTINAPG